jgi:antibiotic biosynthesis monooxygenase (ABM) superfamily enzyme
MMIERHVTFDVLTGQDAAFEALSMSAYRPAMSKMPGFVNVELLRENTDCPAQVAGLRATTAGDDTTKHQMTIRFESLEAVAAWRNSPDHLALKPEIGALYEGSTVQVYEVIA